MTAYITRIRIAVTQITPSPFLLSRRINSGLSSPDMMILRKGQTIRGTFLNDLVHAAKFSPLNLGIILIICKVFIPIIF